MSNTVIDKAILADIKKYIEEHLALAENAGDMPVLYDAIMTPEAPAIREDEAAFILEEAPLPKPLPQMASEDKPKAKAKKHRLSFMGALNAKTASPKDAAKAEALSLEAEEVGITSCKEPEDAEILIPTDLSQPVQSAGKLPEKDEFRTLLSKMGTSFARALQEEIDRRELKDSQVYRKAQLSRAAYSKIITGQATPKKTTAAALLLALELDAERASELLSKAGLSLADNNEFDLIVRYCFEHAIYDIDSINDILYEFDQPLLGSAGK